MKRIIFILTFCIPVFLQAQINNLQRAYDGFYKDVKIGNVAFIDTTGLGGLFIVRDSTGNTPDNLNIFSTKSPARVWIRLTDNGTSVITLSSTTYYFEDSTNTPPVTFPPGADTTYWMVAGAPTGIFVGHDFDVARYVNGVFDVFIDPNVGDWGITLDDNFWHQFNGSTWPRRNPGFWDPRGNPHGGIVGSTVPAIVFLRYNNGNRITLRGNGTQFNQLGGVTMGVMGLNATGLSRRLTLDTLGFSFDNDTLKVRADSTLFALSGTRTAHGDVTGQLAGHNLFTSGGSIYNLIGDTHEFKVVGDFTEWLHVDPVSRNAYLRATNQDSGTSAQLLVASYNEFPGFTANVNKNGDEKYVVLEGSLTQGFAHFAAKDGTGDTLTQTDMFLYAQQNGIYKASGFEILSQEGDPYIHVIGNTLAQTITLDANNIFPRNGSPALGKVPTGTDGAGNWTWQTPSGGGGSGGDALANFYLKDSAFADSRIADLNGNTLRFQEDGENYLFLNPTDKYSIIAALDGATEVDIKVDAAANTITHTADTHVFNGIVGINTTPTNVFDLYPLSFSGTVSVTNGSATVTGTNTRFYDQFKNGDSIYINNAVYAYILSIASQTSLTLTATYSGSTAGTAPYTNPKTERGILRVMENGRVFQYGAPFMINGAGDYANVGYGYNSLGVLTTGKLNTANGARALEANTTGENNTAVGAYAMLKNTSGNLNEAFGLNALYNNISGSENIAIGGYSLYSNTTGNYNVAVGKIAMYGLTSGSGNTATGYDALRLVGAGAQNTATGYEALRSTSGNGNTAMGYDAVRYATPSEVTAIGTAALRDAAGNGSTALGFFAGTVSSGSNNIFIGSKSGQVHDFGVLPGSTTGSNNLIIGTGSSVFYNESNAANIFNTIWIDSNNGTDSTASTTSKVGINTTTPAYTLDVNGVNNATSFRQASGVTWTSGTGSPETVVTAPVGSLYTRTDGGANTTLYVKESGAGNTGWIAK